MSRFMKFVSLFLVLAVFAMFAMGSGSSDSESKGSDQGGAAGVNANAASADEAMWSVGEASVRTWYDSIGSHWIQVIVPVTNVGTVNIFGEACSIDLEDESGHLVDTMSLVSFFPQVLQPGETGAYCEETILDDGIGDNLKALPHVKLQKAKVDCQRLEVSDLDISDEQYFGIKVTGRIENKTSDEISSPYVVAILYDNGGKIVGTTLDITDAVAAGDKIGFSSNASTLPDDVTASTIARYEVFAYPHQFQF